jgi:hypothetical protein
MGCDSRLEYIDGWEGVLVLVDRRSRNGRVRQAGRQAVTNGRIPTICIVFQPGSER